MGILRADRVSGLGGANAINGSVYFKAAQNLRTSNHSDFALGSNDFTIECWWNPAGDLPPPSGGQTDQCFVSLWNNTTNRRAWGMYYDGDTTLFGFIGTTDGIGGGNDRSTYYAHTFAANTWVHLACVRISNTCTVYVDGTAIGSNTSFTGSIYNNTVEPLVIGGQLTGADGSHSYDAKILRGYMSNLRVINGDGIYTANFTPPTTRLEKTANTVLLCCQSPGDITQEATGKDLLPYRSSANNAFPMASHITPDVGEDYGTTFADNTKFDTLSYMVPPGGTTAESNRGRGLIAGGSVPGNSTAIDYFQIQSTSNAQDFGDLTVTGQHTACSSTTRGVFAMGSTNNTIDYVTIATTGNATNFGDRTVALNGPGALSNNTRGVFLGGGAPNPQSDVMDYITIASAGNATDFGNMSSGNKNACGLASPTRGCIAHGGDPFTNVIDYITIATTGNATDFGDTVQAGEGYAGSSSDTRGIWSGGYVQPANQNVIQYITIASTGNAADFGDLDRLTCQSGAGTSNNLRGCTMGGFTPSPSTTATNTMDYITIATTGNSNDFGDITSARAYIGSCSDSHGGIS